MDFEVEPYRSRHFSQVCGLELRGEECGYAAAVFVRQMEELTPSAFFIATAADEVIGFAVGAMSGTGNHDSWVLRLRVLPPYQRKGIGTALMHRLLRALASEGAGRVFLSVSPLNTSALALYIKLGFLVTGERAGYFGPGEDRLILVRDLSGPLS
ncbi:ribosomal protein S18 acetylase RimI-like enzyme [Methanolinea mesophila]|uniref:GNAT family N-acetyltransferase n=1 Tax=Methanolinea mesophila TaxID=547055 RepID=UPI001AE9749C|nr:GNAT family N-acetyltransferase [Methanolinea mesophila]MBP1927568.1 ribosomal protein S18 acetylase RimI-like enzyme [Methanolinea mesophila]